MGVEQLPPRVSYTQISTYNRCRFRFFLQYIMKLHTVAPAKGLVRGAVLHEAYDAYLFNNNSETAAYATMDAKIQEYLDKGASQELMEKIRDESTIVLKSYLPYAQEHDTFKIFIPFEDQKQCETSGTVTLKVADGSTVDLFFKIDALIVKDQGLFMLENKFRSRLDASGLEHDLQTIMYNAAWNVLHPESRVTATLYNIVGAKPRAKDKKIVERSYMYHGDEELNRALSNVSSVVLDMRRSASASPAVWPMNPTKDCAWDCMFVNMCLSVRVGNSLKGAVESSNFRPMADRTPTEDKEPKPAQVFAPRIIGD